MEDKTNESVTKDTAARHGDRYSPTFYERQVVSDVLDAWIDQRDAGFDLEHDLSHEDGALSFAAAAYAIRGMCHPRKLILHHDCNELWPFHDGFKPKGRRENLVRAAAFLLSEIARFDAEKGPKQ